MISDSQFHALIHSRTEWARSGEASFGSLIKEIQGRFDRLKYSHCFPGEKTRTANTFVFADRITGIRFHAIPPTEESPIVLIGETPVLVCQWSQSQESTVPKTNVRIEEVLRWCRSKHLRLPTHAEWETACKGLTNTFHYWKAANERSDQHVWHFHNSGRHLHDCREHEASRNGLGLIDTVGNVWEWTYCPKKMTFRQYGGSYDSILLDERSKFFILATPTRSDTSGFRVCFDLSSPVLAGE